MTSEGVFDKSKWPLQAPDLFWALSDELQDIGELGLHDENFAEYEIDLNDLPDGSLALNSVNAIRNIRVNVFDFPRPLRNKLKAFSLCLGSQTLEYISAEKQRANENSFSIFSGQNILPLFAIDAQLIVRVFFEDLEADEEALLPYKCIDCEGLLVRVKTTSKAFFIGACNQSIVSWDGNKIKVSSQSQDLATPTASCEKPCCARSKACPGCPQKPPREQFFDSPHAKTLIEPHIIESFTSYRDLWTALPLSPEVRGFERGPERPADFTPQRPTDFTPQRPTDFTPQRPCNNPESDSDSDSPFHLF